MQHLAVKAVAEVTDLGEFTAIAATYDVDRVKDQIVLGAFERTIAQWRASGKNLPVHWNHSGAAKDIIGAIDPAAMREVPGQGLYVAGRLDLQESDVAREAWRSMRSNSVALSFGYLATKTFKREDGVQELREIDLFEITVAPGPVNPETRFLSLKAVAERSVPTDAQLRAKAKALGVNPPMSTRQLRRHADDVRLEAALGEHPRHFTRRAKAAATDAQHTLDSRALRKRCDDLRLELALGNDSFTQPPTPPASRTPSPDLRTRVRDEMLALLLDDGEGR
jgi:HK97 family phage prohead protease